MEKSKRLNSKKLYWIPFVVQVIIHIVAPLFMRYHINFSISGVLSSVIITAFAMLFGEGYGSVAFIVAGFYDRVIAYIFVLIFSVVSAGASFVGYMFSGIEGQDCLWMTFVFCCIDLFLFVFSIIRINQLSLRRAK